MQLTAILRDHTRAQCAAAAMSRVQQPPVNLLGLDNSEAHARRRRCHDAALLRFVMPTETEPKGQYDNRTHKRRSDDDDMFHKTLLQLCGNDSWSPVLCGKAHTFKRPKLQLYDDGVRNAMVGVY